MQNGRSFSRGPDFDFSDQNTESETHVPPSISFREKHHFERDTHTHTRTDTQIHGLTSKFKGLLHNSPLRGQLIDAAKLLHIIIHHSGYQVNFLRDTTMRMSWSVNKVNIFDIFLEIHAKFAKLELLVF